MQAGWRRVYGVNCDRRVAGKVKVKVYKTVVRPELLYAWKTAALTKRQEMRWKKSEKSQIEKVWTHKEEK